MDKETLFPYVPYNAIYITVIMILIVCGYIWGGYNVCNNSNGELLKGFVCSEIKEYGVCKLPGTQKLIVINDSYFNDPGLAYPD